MSPAAIRAIITGLTGAATALGVIPEGASDAVAENAGQVVGGVLMLWSIFAGLRAKKERAEKVAQ